MVQVRSISRFDAEKEISELKAEQAVLRELVEELMAKPRPWWKFWEK